MRKRGLKMSNTMICGKDVAEQANVDFYNGTGGEYVECPGCENEMNYDPVYNSYRCVNPECFILKEYHYLTIDEVQEIRLEL